MDYICMQESIYQLTFDDDDYSQFKNIHNNVKGKSSVFIFIKKDSTYETGKYYANSAYIDILCPLKT